MAHRTMSAGSFLLRPLPPRRGWSGDAAGCPS